MKALADIVALLKKAGANRIRGSSSLVRVLGSLDVNRILQRDINEDILGAYLRELFDVVGGRLTSDDDPVWEYFDRQVLDPPTRTHPNLVFQLLSHKGNTRRLGFITWHTTCFTVFGVIQLPEGAR